MTFRHLVERYVVGHDQVRVGGDEEAVAGHAARLQPVDLLEQDSRVDHDAVADDGSGLLRQHAGRQQVQGVAVLAYDDGMPGVVAALVSHHVVDVVTQQVGGLALALVAPLRAHDHDGRHLTGPSR